MAETDTEKVLEIFSLELWKEQRRLVKERLESTSRVAGVLQVEIRELDKALGQLDNAIESWGTWLS